MSPWVPELLKDNIQDKTFRAAYRYDAKWNPKKSDAHAHLRNGGRSTLNSVLFRTKALQFSPRLLRMPRSSTFPMIIYSWSIKGALVGYFGDACAIDDRLTCARCTSRG